MLVRGRVTGASWDSVHTHTHTYLITTSHPSCFYCWLIIKNPFGTHHFLVCRCNIQYETWCSVKYLFTTKRASLYVNNQEPFENPLVFMRRWLQCRTFLGTHTQPPQLLSLYSVVIFFLPFNILFETVKENSVQRWTKTSSRAFNSNEDQELIAVSCSRRG